MSELVLPRAASTLVHHCACDGFLSLRVNKGAHVCSLESSKSPPKPENHTNWQTPSMRRSYRFSGCEGDKAAKNFIRVSARVAWRAATCAISRAMRPASSASLSAAMIIPRETFEKHACADSPRHDR